MPAEAVTERPDAGPVWTPGPARVARANLARFLQRIRALPGAETVADVPTLYRWSAAQPEAFWPEVWDFCGVIADPWNEVVVGLERMAPPDPVLGPRWFTGARLNFAENLLRFADDREALVFWNELGRQRALSYRELNEQVAAVAEALRADGIQPGDRVAGFLPNLPETVIAMLATASLGAIWSSCSPDFGVQGIQGWSDPPILDNPSETKTINGREYEIFAESGRIKLIAWHRGESSYWISNDLLNSLSNDQMVGMARSIDVIVPEKKPRKGRSKG